MPNVDQRTNVQGGRWFKRNRTMFVTYVNARRQTRQARVIGPGTSSGLKLEILEPASNNDTSGLSTMSFAIDHRIVDNVPLQASLTSVNCYIARLTHSVGDSIGDTVSAANQFDFVAPGPKVD